MYQLINKVSSRKYEVLDTDDGAVDVMDWTEILNCVLNCGVTIQGVVVSGDEVLFTPFDKKFVRILSGNKFRLYPTGEQKDAIDKTIDCCRLVHNVMLSDKIDFYNNYGDMLDNRYQDYFEKYPFLKKVSSSALQQESRHLDVAYKNFFRGIISGQKIGYPRFKSRFDSEQSFSDINNNNNIKLYYNMPSGSIKCTGRIKLPRIKTPVRIMVSRPITGRIKTVTVSRNSCGEYYCSMNTEEYREIDISDTQSEVGIDLGIVDLAVVSTGERLPNNEVLDKNLAKLKVLQQKFSRTQKGSNRRNKLRIQIARLHKRIANMRLDLIHKFTHRIVIENKAIYTENLNIKGMVRNPKRSRKRRTRCRHIANASWYEFIRQFKYKCEWNNRVYNQVGRMFPSTQLCSICGYKNTSLRGNTKIREYDCPVCHTYHDRDLNAAINILKEGQRLSA